VTAFARTRSFDALIAAAITAWCLVEVVVEDLQQPWLAAFLLAIAGCSLYWRHSYPILVGLIVVASGIGQAAAGISLHDRRRRGAARPERHAPARRGLCAGEALRDLTEREREGSS